MKLCFVVGARPNLMKVAPVLGAARAVEGVDATLVHTGQHYDAAMSEVFFSELELPPSDVFLGVGKLTPCLQTARIIEQLGEYLGAERPDWVVVPGDVNSTLAAAIAAVRTGCRVAHLEAGLRSFDREMPEELNRIAVDHLADILFVTERSGLENLTREGIPESRVAFVGNTMIDTLVRFREVASEKPLDHRYGIADGDPFVLVTMHRPSNVDRRDGLERLAEIVRHAATKGRVIFPMHPRTRERFREFGLDGSWAHQPNVCLTPPLGYVEFLSLLMKARVVLTDSGGIQEETTALGVTCLTLRDSTERPSTCEVGTNRLLGTNPEVVRRHLDEVWEHPLSGRLPDLWDGHAAARVMEVFLSRESPPRD